MPLTPRERRLIARLRTPQAVARWLRAIPYNKEARGETLRSFRGVIKHRTAHCLEAALFSAAVLERLGYPPLLLDLESKDGLDHVLFLFKGPKGWGTVGRSRYPGLHGRKPVFKTLRALVDSYIDPFVDETGRMVRWGVYDLRKLKHVDWRLSAKNVWTAEQTLIHMRHKPIKVPEKRHRLWHARYLAWAKKNPGRQPDYFPTKRLWL